jgi:hypothetical protein
MGVKMNNYRIRRESVKEEVVRGSFEKYIKNAFGEMFLEKNENDNYASDHIRVLWAGYMEWISVKEKMPKVGELVIAFSPIEYFDDDDKVFLDETFIDKDGKVQWEWGENTVTHWIPLPEQPKTTHKS